MKINKLFISGIFLVLIILFVAIYSYNQSSLVNNNIVPSNNGGVANNNSQYKTIVYVGFAKEQQPFWTEMGRLIEQAASVRNINYLDLTPQIPSVEDQIVSLNAAIDQNVSGIIVGANLPSKLMIVLGKARDANIPVVAVDTDIDSPAVVSAIATDNLESARVVGDYIVSATGGKGTVLIIAGEKTHPNSMARVTGVKEKAEQAGMSVIVDYADWQIEKAYSFTREELLKSNNITAIFACWDPGIISAQQVVQDLNLENKIILVGFDGLQETYNLIQSGKLSATVAQPMKQMAREGVETIINYLSNKPVNRIKLVPGIVVTKSNVGYFLD